MTQRASFGRQMWLLSRRSIAGTLRNAGVVIPALTVPLILFFVLASGLSAAEKVPGFPTKSFVTFALAVPFVNGALVAIANSGQAIATDIESGFIDRLSLTPMRRYALFGSQLAGVLVIGILQGAIFLGIGLGVGAHIKSGVLGGVVLIVLFLLTVVAFGALGMMIGMRTGSGEAVQAIAPMMTVFLFMSSMNFPRNLMEKEWFKWIATVNPLSYLVEGVRGLLIYRWDFQALGLGFAVAIGILLLGLFGSVQALKTRLVRT